MLKLTDECDEYLCRYTITCRSRSIKVLKSFQVKREHHTQSLVCIRVTRGFHFDYLYIVFPLEIMGVECRKETRNVEAMLKLDLLIKSSEGLVKRLSYLGY